MKNSSLYVTLFLIAMHASYASQITGKVNRFNNRILQTSADGTDSSSSTDQYSIGTDTQNQYFQQIKDNIKSIQDSYTNCIDDIADPDYSETAIDACVGKNLIYMDDDISYERKKMLGIVDKKIRDYMMTYCYKIAGMNAAQSAGCDVLEADVLELLWAEFNFETAIDYHRQKYLFTYGEVPVATFDQIVTYLKSLYDELSSLITEIYYHGQLANANIKAEINRRTKLILKKASDSAQNPQPKVYTHSIQIQEKINAPGQLNVNQLPRPIVMDTSNQLYQGHINQYVEQFKKYTGNQLDSNDGLNSINASSYGPVVIIPSRKLKQADDSKKTKLKRSIK